MLNEKQMKVIFVKLLKTSLLSLCLATSLISACTATVQQPVSETEMQAGAKVSDEIFKQIESNFKQNIREFPILSSSETSKPETLFLVVKFLADSDPQEEDPLFSREYYRVYLYQMSIRGKIQRTSFSSRGGYATLELGLNRLDNSDCGDLENSSSDYKGYSTVAKALENKDNPECYSTLKDRDMRLSFDFRFDEDKQVWELEKLKNKAANNVDTGPGIFLPKIFNVPSLNTESFQEHFELPSQEESSEAYAINQKWLEMLKPLEQKVPLFPVSTDN